MYRIHSKGLVITSMLSERKKGVAINVVLMFVFQLAGAATPLLVFPHLIRVLGDTQFGHLAYVYTTATALSIVVEYGFNFTAVRDVARLENDLRARSRLYLNTQVAKVIMLIPASVSYFVLCIYGADVALPLALCGFPILLAMAVLPFWYFQGMERIKVPVTILVIGRLAAAALILVFVSDSNDTWIAIFLLSGGVLLPALLLAYLVRPLVSIRTSDWNLTAIQRHIWNGRFVFISNISGALMVQGPVVLLGIFMPPASVGIFAAIDKLCFMLRFSYLPVNRALFPVFSRKFQESSRKAFARLIVVAIIGAVVLVMVSLFAYLARSSIIDLYMGSTSPESLALFSILIWVPVATFLRSCAVTLGLLPLGRDRLQMILQVLGGGGMLLALSMNKGYTDLSDVAFIVAGVEVLMAIASWGVLVRSVRVACKV